MLQKDPDPIGKKHMGRTMGGLFKEAVDVGSTVEWKADGMSVTYPECCDQPGGCADVTLRALAQGKGWSLHAKGGFW